MLVIFKELKNYIYEWAAANVPTGMPVIYLYPNAPRPEVDYVSLFISTYNMIGQDYVPDPINDAGDVTQVGDREFTLQIQAFGGDPMTILGNLRNSLQKETVLDTLRLNGIVAVQQYAINDITSLMNSRFENRASMDVLFRIADQYLDTLGTIAQIELEETILNVDSSTIFNETVLIPITI